MESPALDTLIVVLLFFYSLILAGLVWVYGWQRVSRPVRETYTQKLCECLQPQDRLPSMVFPDIEYSFNRRILIRLLSGLSPMLEGVEGRILHLIFHDNGLDRHILQECRVQDDLRKTVALSVFIDVPIPESLMIELRRFLDSANPELRMVALLVWLNQDPARMLDRLAVYPHELSERDCANVYALAQRRYVPLSETEKLLGSANPSVRRFGRHILKLKGAEN